MKNPNITEVNEMAQVLAARGEVHGDFKRQARFHNKLMAVMGESDCTLSPQIDSALMMITGKMARIATGSPFYRDHWLDIAGYAHLMVKYIDEDVTPSKEADKKQVDLPNIQKQGGTVGRYPIDFITNYEATVGTADNPVPDSHFEVDKANGA